MVIFYDLQLLWFDICVVVLILQLPFIRSRKLWPPDIHFLLRAPDHEMLKSFPFICTHWKYLFHSIYCKRPSYCHKPGIRCQWYSISPTRLSGNHSCLHIVIVVSWSMCSNIFHVVACHFMCHLF